jgi:transcriptional regulator with XRE-family HTH domain
MKTENYQNIKLIREKIGLSQEEVAKYLGIKRELISYYETGSRPVPLELMERLADFYGIDLADLLSDNKEVLNANLAFALRTIEDELDKEDLENIASFKKVVMNYLKMIELNK